MYRNGLGQIEAIPGVDTAIATIKAKVGEFLQLPQRIIRAQEKAKKLMQVANMKRNTEAATKLFGVQTALHATKEKVAQLTAKLNAVLDQLKKSGIPGLGILPVIPLVLAGSVVLVAGGIVASIKSVSFQEKVLEDIEKKLLTPEEATKLFGPKPFFGLQLGGIAPLLIIGVLAIGAMAFMRK